jgi:hypothetical protein
VIANGDEAQVNQAHTILDSATIHQRLLVKDEKVLQV